MSSTAAAHLQITLNGQPHALPSNSCIRDLVAQLALDPKAVAIEQNLAIVPRSAYATTPIHDRDAIEIVGFIGGG
ncbi:MAG: sulfur carrier protein ThiS [Pseudomonadota bacterium]